MKEIIFAGFGGQGVLTSGLVIAYTAARAGLNATWMPAYGPTMRGGKANCVIKISDDENETIGSPIMENADCLVVMNEPSLDYVSFCKKGASIICNAAAVTFVDFPEVARSVHNEKGMNIVAAGYVIKKYNMFSDEFAIESMCKFWEEKGKANFNELNTAAMKAGFDLVK